MKLEIQTKRQSDGMGRLKDRYDILVTLEGYCLDLYRKGLQQFYKGILKGKDPEGSFLLGLEQKCNLKSKIVVADDSTKIRIATAEENADLQRALECLEAKYFIAPRNEWVSHTDFHQFYRPGNNDTDYRPGTPVERLRQAAFDTRRTGTAWFDLGLLKTHQPDVKFMIDSLCEECFDLSVYMDELSLEVRKYEGNDGYIKPKLTTEEANKAAKLFEQMAEIVEPHWKRIEADYEKQRGKEDGTE